VFLYDFATKTAQKPDTVATYIRRNEKIFKNHVERREKQLWLDEKAVKILLKKYPEVQRKKKSSYWREKFLFCRTKKNPSSVSKDVSTCENNKRHVGDSCKTRKHICLRLFSVTIFRKKQASYLSDKRQIELVGMLPNPKIMGSIPYPLK
jgi:hypothetical protein